MNPDSEMNLMKRAGWKHPALLSVLVPGRSRGEGAHPHPGAGDRMQHGVTYPGLPLPMGFVILPSDQGVILLTQEDSYSLPSQRSFFLQVNSHSAYPSRIEIASPTYPNLSSVYSTIWTAFSSHPAAFHFPITSSRRITCSLSALMRKRSSMSPTRNRETTTADFSESSWRRQSRSLPSTGMKMRCWRMLSI